MIRVVKIVLFCLVICSGSLVAQQVSGTVPDAGSARQTNESAGFTPFPREISYQGLLTTSAGVPAADGTYDLQFDLFYFPVGGGTLWTETHSGVTVSKGTFTVRLGSITTLPNFFYEINYLEVSALAGPGISGTVTFSPRTQLTAAAYALGPWQTNNYDIYVPYASVGIGTASPTEKLHIANGNMLLSNGNVYMNNGRTVFSPGTSPLMTAGMDNVNAKRMWIGHSETYPTWGIQYRDFDSDGKFGDAVEFVHGNQANPSMSFELYRGNLRLYDSSGTGKFILNSREGKAGFGTLTPATNMEMAGTGLQTLRLTSTDNNDVSFELKRSSISQEDYQFLNYGSFLQIGYANDIDNQSANGLMYFGNEYNISSRNFIPNSSNTYDLGTSTWRWRDVYTINAVNSSSDIRLKENINELSYGLSEVMKLRPVSYTWKNSPEQGTKLGLIAQEVRPVINEIVKEGNDADKTLALSYTELIPVLIKAVQEQEQLIENLNKQVAATQAENVELRKVKNQYEALSVKIQRIEEMMRRSERTATVTTASNK